MQDGQRALWQLLKIDRIRGLFLLTRVPKNTSMPQLKKYVYEDQKYYSIVDLHRHNHEVFAGCSNAADFISKYGLSETEWLRKVSTKAYVKILCVQALQADILERPLLARYNSQPPLINLSEKKQHRRGESDKRSIPDVRRMEYHDRNGRVIKIEIRGEPKHGACYFLVADVEKAFGLKGLEQQLLSRLGYTTGADYMLFRSPKGQTRMFLTHSELQSAISRYRHPDGASIRSWLMALFRPTPR